MQDNATLPAFILINHITDDGADTIDDIVAALEDGAYLSTVPLLQSMTEAEAMEVVEEAYHFLQTGD